MVVHVLQTMIVPHLEYVTGIHLRIRHSNTMTLIHGMHLILIGMIVLMRQVHESIVEMVTSDEIATQGILHHVGYMGHVERQYEDEDVEGLLQTHKGILEHVVRLLLSGLQLQKLQ